uniref:MULE transposase domain-containing protein n=1 Tax=Panagrolaimus sp. ES5 TaxID=591445 RepID=A0AC34G9G9_9BILA
MRRDRRDYSARCKLSQEQPLKFLSAIIDGMSKTQLRLPKLYDHRSKKVEDNDRMYCNLNLVLVHRKDTIYSTKSIGMFSPGACYDNTTNSMLSQLLFGLTTCSVIPPTVFIQVDNFAANKSYVFFATFGYLLKRQSAIKEFYISFMMPGHTHCDVDAKFGNFSTYLKTTECGSPTEMMDAFVEALHGEAYMQQTIYNFKEVLHPYCLNYHAVKSFYDFHIFLNEDGIPMVENARHQLSETLLCGGRQDANSFITKIFKKMPASDIKFRIVPPKLENLEKLPKVIPKWEKVITAEAKSELLSLKTTIESYKGTPFTSLMATIESKSVTCILREQQALLNSQSSTPPPRSATTSKNLAETEEMMVQPVQRKNQVPTKSRVKRPTNAEPEETDSSTTRRNLKRKAQ